MVGDTIAFGLITGVAATLTMDILGAGSRRVGLTRDAKPQWIGRWFLGIRPGRFTCPDIAEAPEQPHEELAALLGHNAIGIALALLYVAGTGWLDLSPDEILVALGYGFATNVFPWFLMFPAMGFGSLGLKGPEESRLFVSSLANHLYYGLGLWWITALLPLG